MRREMEDTTSNASWAEEMESDRGWMDWRLQSRVISFSRL